MSGLFEACCDCGTSDVDDYCCTDEPSGCGDTFCGYTKIATITMGAVTSGETLDFGTQIAGLYYGVYCGGMYSTGKETFASTVATCCGESVNVFDVGSPLWGIVQGNNPKLIWAYSDACGTDCADVPDECSDETAGCTGSVNNPGLGSVTPNLGAAFATEADAIAAYTGVYNSFQHSGGNISLKFFDCPDGDNTAGSPLPSFSLYRATSPTPKFSLLSACAAWVTAGTSATVTITIRNRTCVCWSDVTATLSTSGGITSPGAPIGPFVIASKTNKDLTYTFDASDVGVTATVTLTSSNFASPIVLTVYLAPILSVVVSYDGVSGFIKINVFNTGNWALNITSGSYAFSNGWGRLPFLSPCTPGDNPIVDSATRSLSCATGAFYAFANPQPICGGSPDTTVVTATLTEGSLSYTPIASNTYTVI